MTDPNQLRAEIEQILINHSRTRSAKVLRGMKRDLTDAEISQEAYAAGEGCSVENITYVRKTVCLTLDDQLVAAPSDALAQADLYRELLNYSRSPELHQRIITRLTQLRAIDPAVKLTPLGEGHLGAGQSTRSETPAELCGKCHLVHKGDCF